MAWPDWMVPYISLSKYVPLELRHRIGISNKTLVEYITSPDSSQQVRVIDLDLSDNSVSSLDKIPASSLSQLRDVHLKTPDRDLQVDIHSFIYRLPDSIRSLRMRGPYVLQNPLTLFLPTLHTLELHIDDSLFKYWIIRRCLLRYGTGNLSSLQEIHRGVCNWGQCTPSLVPLHSSKVATSQRGEMFGDRL